MPLVDQPFAATFTFSRARAAHHVNAAGEVVTAAVDAPRFDHDAAGLARGLLIEGRPQYAAADRLAVIDGDWATPAGTVLHELELDGQVQRRAWYAPGAPRDTVNACLLAKGRHRRIAYVPGYLKNRDGFVRWRRLDWRLGGLVAVEAGVVLAVTDDHVLLEG